MVTVARSGECCAGTDGEDGTPGADGEDGTPGALCSFPSAYAHTQYPTLQPCEP